MGLDTDAVFLCVSTLSLQNTVGCAVQKKEEEAASESDEDMGFGLFD